ncbi:MAG: EAL domain-containing protein [Terriglobales bacterium]
MRLKLALSLFALIAILTGIGQLGLRRMQEISETLNDITGKQSAKLELAERALELSNDNSRIAMEIVFLENRALVDTLLAARSENSKEISRLLDEIKGHCNSEKEKQLLSAIEGTRRLYVASYLRAIHLLVDDKRHKEAEATIVSETIPALIQYHAALREFVEFEKDRLDAAVKQAQVHYAKAHRFALLLVVLSVVLALTIARFASYAVEAELQRSEERMLTAMEAANLGSWDLDVIKDEHVWSDTCKALLGLPPESPANFETLMTMVHPDDQKMMLAEINRAIQEKRDYLCEYRVVWPDQSVHWRCSSGRAFYDSSQRVTRMAGITMDIDERRYSEDRLHLQAAALEAAANAIVITDSHGTIIWVNHAFTTMTGYTKEEVLGKNPRLLKSGDQLERYYAELWSTISSGKVWRGEIVNRRKDGTTYTEEMTITPVIQIGNPVDTKFIAIKQDISERKRKEQALEEAEEKYRAIFEGAVIGIFRGTPAGRPLSVNRAMAEMHGYDSPEQLLAEVSNVAQQLFVDPNRMNEIRNVLAANGVVRSVELEIYRRDRTRKWVLLNLHAVRDSDDSVLFHEGTLEDITDRKVAEARVQFLAYYDALTSLPNRILLQDRLAKALADARRQKYKVALLFLDLDRFKDVNDSLGHSFGDLLLQEVAERLKTWGREQDTIARLGGDEFLIMLTHVKDVPDAAVAAERLMNAMTAEFVIGTHSLNISCSVGISIFPEHGADGETLMKNADAAMYSAKENGRHNFRFFTEHMNTEVVKRLTLEKSLRVALERQEFFLVYQPQMDIGSGRVIGLEALIRWQHPELGLVPPDEFIHIAENIGLIVPIGEWVLRTACSQAQQWQDKGLLGGAVAVNVSAVQFRQEGFCELIKRILHETGLPPRHLELELTESLLLANADVTLSVVQELRALGLTLAIDDFGTGYSSFSYLRQFRVSKLKIDRLFIRDVALNPDDAAITAAIISMAKSLKLKVLAEGVEDEAQMTFLRTHQCDEIQGYYFSKPLLVDQATDKLRAEFHGPHARAQAHGKQS